MHTNIESAIVIDYFWYVISNNLNISKNPIGTPLGNTHQNWRACIFHNLYLQKHFETIPFFIPWIIVHGLKGNVIQIGKGAESPKMEMPHSPNFVHEPLFA